MRLLKVAEPLPGCSGGKVLRVESSEQNVKHVMSKKGVQVKAETNLLKWKKKAKETGGTHAPLKQTVREGTQEPMKQTKQPGKGHKHSGEEITLMRKNRRTKSEASSARILEEERQHLCEVPAAAECHLAQFVSLSRSRKQFKGWRAGKVQAAAVEHAGSGRWEMRQDGVRS